MSKGPGADQLPRTRRGIVRIVRSSVLDDFVPMLRSRMPSCPNPATQYEGTYRGTQYFQSRDQCLAIGAIRSLSERKLQSGRVLSVSWAARGSASPNADRPDSRGGASRSFARCMRPPCDGAIRDANGSHRQTLSRAGQISISRSRNPHYRFASGTGEASYVGCGYHRAATRSA